MSVMRSVMRKIAIWGVLALMAVAFAAVPALAQNPHFVTEPVCTDNGGTVVCTGGKVAGLGNEPVSVFYTGQFACETQSGSNQPPGQSRSKVATITPKGGSINLPRSTLSSGCHGTQTPIAPSEVTLHILNQAGTEVFTADIPVQ
jgi:hypothetical protein